MRSGGMAAAVAAAEVVEPGSVAPGWDTHKHRPTSRHTHWHRHRHTLALPLMLLLACLTTANAGYTGCPRPSGVQHGWLNLTETNRGSVPAGTTLQYGCDPGYVLDGSSIITCTASGHWSSEPPLCIRTDACRPPSEPENGGYTCHPSPCHRFTQGTAIEYYCNEGYALNGEYKLRICQNGDWDPALPITCHPAQDNAVQGCPRPLNMLHGWTNLSETNRGSFPVGTPVQYTCDAGYVLDGPSIATCTASGHWSFEPPLCIRTDDCQPPSEPENGGYTCHPTPCRRLSQGTVIEYFCDEGYALKGDYKYRTCQNGQWEEAMQISCHLSQGKDERSPLAMPPWSMVLTTASLVLLILLLVVLFVLLQPKLKSLHHSRREQGVSGQPSSIVVEGVQVSLPSYEEAVYGSSGLAAAAAPPHPASSSSSAPQESRVQIVLSEGPQSDAGSSQSDCRLLPCTSSSSSSSSSASGAVGGAGSSVRSSSMRHHAETVLVHPAPSCSTSPSSSSCTTSPYSPPSPCSWAAEPPGASGGAAAAAAASLHRHRGSDSSDQHSLLSLTSSEDFADDIPLLKEA
ncbi:sushi domain-containing protein 6 isoform X1 [Engraulis encrasicolus]|uniref:sushi domain-containing protein 6 isoform X1 n=1 Tax=Engraulis encrasicolus TaxID=184585 RepID=UPI002FD15BFD